MKPNERKTKEKLSDIGKDSIIIESSISVSDLKIIRKALIEEKEFMMIYEDGKLESLTSQCFLAKDISKKVIAKAS